LTLLAVELLFENFMCWAIAALDRSKYSYRPLQDPGADLLTPLAMALPAPLRKFPGYTVMHFVALLAFGVFAKALRGGLNQRESRPMLAKLTRVFATLIASTVLKVACFSVTILPNPRPRCYARR